MSNHRALVVLAACPLALLSACGGGNGGGIASTPAPAPSPSPTPRPSPQSATILPTGPLAATQDYATVGTVTRGSAAPDGDDVQVGAPSMDAPIRFRYSAETQTYTLAAPDYKPGTLVPDTSTAGTMDFNVADGTDVSLLQKLRAILNFSHRDGSSIVLTYTGFGAWIGVTDQATRTSTSQGIFAYGVPTSASDVPVTGSAKYTALVVGQGMVAGWREPIAIGGKAELSFDFGSGTFSGHMNPTLMDDWGPSPLGHYEFADTVHGVGSQTFSGRFVVPGSNASSGFSGRFNGPGASEVMASWFAPSGDPSGSASTWGTMSGIWVGKKD